MNRRGVFGIVLIVIAVLAVLAVGAIGVRALMFHRGFASGLDDRVPYGLRGDGFPNGDTRRDLMPYGGDYPRGMMPFGAYGHRDFGSPLVGLLIVGLLGLGIVNFVQTQHIRRMVACGHSRPGDMSRECYPHEYRHKGAATTQDVTPEPPEVTPTEAE